MICQRCGKENKDDSVFCAYCGADFRQQNAPMPAPQEAKPKEEKKSGMVVAILLGLFLIGMGIMNVIHKNAGESYLVWLEVIPAHYAMIPAGLIMLIGGFASLSKKK